MSYKEFVEFHKDNPNMDNAEYYAKYPDVSKSTIRSWKSRIRTPIAPEPTKTEVIEANGYEEQTKHYVEMLLTQTKSKLTEFEGVDNKSKILILKNRLRVQKEEQTNKPTGSNSSIMPVTAAIGSVREEIGLSKYIEFDKNLNEIRMEIPLSKLMDPESNKALRE